MKGTIILVVVCLVIIWLIYLNRKRLIYLFVEKVDDRGRNLRKLYIVKDLFDGLLKKGDIAFFGSTYDNKLKVSDIVSISLPGYDNLWKVIEINEETGKVVLTDGKDVLEDFPISHIKDKLISVENYERLFNKENN